MTFWNDPERLRWWVQCLTWVILGVPTFAAIARQVLDSRERHLSQIARNAEIATLRSRTESRTLSPTPQMLTALNTDPRGPIHVIIDSYDGEEAHEYLDQWMKLFIDTHWHPEGLLILEPSIPKGVVTLVIRNPNPYTLHLHDVLVGSGLPISIAPPDAPFLKKFPYLSEEVLLFIGRRP